MRLVSVVVVVIIIAGSQRSSFNFYPGELADHLT
jgi:hypothetical protein